jgi:hypothetical protein
MGLDRIERTYMTGQTRLDKINREEVLGRIKRTYMIKRGSIDQMRLDKINRTYEI